METICQHCQKGFSHTGKGRHPKYCPSCQQQAYGVRRLQLQEQRQAVQRQPSVLNPGPAHKLGLDAVLRELEQFHALRRAEGRSVVSYGRYVAMRDHLR